MGGTNSKTMAWLRFCSYLAFSNRGKTNASGRRGPSLPTGTNIVAGFVWLVEMKTS